MLLIFDGNNFAYRAKYSMSLSHPSTNVDVSVTFGVLKAITATIKKFKPDSVIVTWDGGTPKFRREANPAYKVNRKASRDYDPDDWKDFLRQMKELEDILPIFGIITARKRYCEADDLMYHAAKMYNGNSIIVTTDKDLLQAVDDNVSVYSPSKDILYTPELVEKEIGLPIDKFIDWRAIQGDKSDNIAGVKGIGEKTATKLLRQFGTLTYLINAADDRNPGKYELSDKMKKAINDFGWDRIVKNVYTMILCFDRVGARLEILEAVEYFESWNRKEVKQYLISQSFMSLLEPDVMRTLSNLKKPDMDYNSYRIPVIQEVRWPV